MSVYTWEVLSIPPMSGMTLTPKSALAMKVTTLLYTWWLLSEDAVTQKKSHRHSEEGINCTVAKHSIGCKEGKCMRDAPFDV